MIRCALTLLAAFAFSSAWAQSPAERAIQVLDQLDAGQIEEVTATFTDEMSAGLDAATLSQLWASLPQQLGALQQRGTPQEQRQDGHDVVLVPLQYERRNPPPRAPTRRRRPRSRSKRKKRSNPASGRRHRVAGRCKGHRQWPDGCDGWAAPW